MHAEDYLPKVRTSTDEKEQFEFLKQNKPGMAIELAKSNVVSPRVLDILTRHPLITVRHEVAKNPRCTPETLKRLSDDKDMLVRDYARRTLQKILK